MRIQGAQLTFALIVSLFLGLFAWASTFEVDQVVRAEAKVVPVQDVVRLQNRFPGAVQEVLVELGDSVGKGQVLFRIDPEESEIDLTQVVLALSTAEVERARLIAQINESEPDYPAGAPQQIVEAQNALLLSKRSEFAARRRLINTEISALELAVSESQTTVAAARRQAKLARREVELLEPLVKIGAEPSLSLIQAERALNDLIERIDVNEVRVRRLAADLETKERLIDQEQENFLLEARERLAEIQVEINRVEGERARAGDRRARSEVVSPIDGVVTALPFAVVGQIAEAGTVLAELVPRDTTYKVEAKIKPVDVSSIKVGQLARLSLVAYDFADYGHIDVRLEEVAQNLTEPQQAEPYYSAELSISNQSFSKSGEPVNLMPGLIGQIDILGEPVTVIDYISKPINRLASRALTEK